METDPSIFEIIETNITGPRLSRRFKSVLQRLKEVDPDLLDLFLMVAYLQRCRIPVSHDTASAFLRGIAEKYQEVVRMFDRIGAMVTEYKGNLVDIDQDYYVPRSTIVSEAVINQSSTSDFRRMYTRFHDEVSPLRICRYDIFRRKAYSAEFVNKAFPKWADGVSFYEKIIEKSDKSQIQYLYQQGSLYLLHKKQLNKAFTWSDKAILISGNRILSIRNTHATVLFRANINFPEDEEGTVRRTLTQSMEILSECYSFDKRKSYHAITFADQAIQYYARYGDSASVKYLETAKKWLEKEMKKSPWNTQISKMRKLVNRELSSI